MREVQQQEFVGHGKLMVEQHQHYLEEYQQQYKQIQQQDFLLLNLQQVEIITKLNMV